MDGWMDGLFHVGFDEEEKVFLMRPGVGVQEGRSIVIRKRKTEGRQAGHTFVSRRISTSAAQAVYLPSLPRAP